jgi:hypothetical protein
MRGVKTLTALGFVSFDAEGIAVVSDEIAARYANTALDWELLPDEPVAPVPGGPGFVIDMTTTPSPEVKTEILSKELGNIPDITPVAEPRKGPGRPKKKTDATE